MLTRRLKVTVLSPSQDFSFREAWMEREPSTIASRFTPASAVPNSQSI